MNKFDGEIKLNRWNKKIKVNDNGDYIEINIGDSTLIGRFIEMLENSKKIIENWEALEGTDKKEEIKEAENLHKKLAEIFENFFGVGSCIKVFGVKYPLAEDILDFLFLVNDFVEKFISEKEEHNNEIKNKYIEKSKIRKKV